MKHAGELTAQFDAIAQDAHKLVAGLDDQCGAWRATAESWSVAQCLEHLAASNRVYLEPMQDAARAKRTQRRLSILPGIPGLMGHWFASSLEPPARAPFKAKAPSSIRPSGAPTLHEAFADFMAAHHQVAAFVNEGSGLDRVSFRNPFVRGLSFSVASGLQIIAAHDRRHLWQAWNIRRSAEAALSPTHSAPPQNSRSH